MSRKLQARDTKLIGQGLVDERQTHPLLARRANQRLPVHRGFDQMTQAAGLTDIPHRLLASCINLAVALPVSMWLYMSGASEVTGRALSALCVVVAFTLVSVAYNVYLRGRPW